MRIVLASTAAGEDNSLHNMVAIHLWNAVPITVILWCTVQSLPGVGAGAGAVGAGVGPLAKHCCAHCVVPVPAGQAPVE